MKTYTREGAFKGASGQRAARHGTQSGYVRHRQVGEIACVACKAAHAAYVRTRREITRTHTTAQAL